MRPTSNKLRGQICLGLPVRLCVRRACVTLVVEIEVRIYVVAIVINVVIVIVMVILKVRRSKPIRDGILKFGVWNEYEN